MTSDYVMELKSVVMLSQSGIKEINLLKYVMDLEKSIMAENGRAVDKKGEMAKLHTAYQQALDELLGIKEE